LKNIHTSREFNFFGPKIGLDIFCFENGKIAEHWDVIEPIAPKETWKNNTGKHKSI